MIIAVCAAHLTAHGCSYVCQICWAHRRCPRYHHSHPTPNVCLQRVVFFFFFEDKTTSIIYPVWLNCVFSCVYVYLNLFEDKPVPDCIPPDNAPIEV